MSQVYNKHTFQLTVVNTFLHRQKKISCQLFWISYSQEPRQTLNFILFLKYQIVVLQVNFSLAVDFTGSNGDSKRPHLAPPYWSTNTLRLSKLLEKLSRTMIQTSSFLAMGLVQRFHQEGFYRRTFTSVWHLPTQTSEALNISCPHIREHPKLLSCMVQPIFLQSLVTW